MNTTKDYYRFYTEVTDPKSGETVRVEWDGLTLANAKKMYKLTEEHYAVKDGVATVERTGWAVMR